MMTGSQVSVLGVRALGEVVGHFFNLIQRIVQEKTFGLPSNCKNICKCIFRKFIFFKALFSF